MPDKTEAITHIELDKLIPFKDHPFAVREDEALSQTVESVKEYGVIVPAIARPIGDGTFELISGHRRKRACELAGLTTMPVIVRDIDRDAATILMVDSNLQRENILPSGRAKAYKMKLDAKWLSSNAKVPNREIVRAVIDDILSRKPADFDDFLVQLEKAGYTVKRGKHITITHPSFKKNIRLKSLGDGYTEEDIRAVIRGAKSHTPKERRSILDAPKNTLLIGIEAKLREGKDHGYEQWAKVYNLKQIPLALQ